MPFFFKKEKGASHKIEKLKIKKVVVQEFRAYFWTWSLGISHDLSLKYNSYLKPIRLKVFFFWHAEFLCDFNKFFHSFDYFGLWLQ